MKVRLKMTALFPYIKDSILCVFQEFIIQNPLKINLLANFQKDAANHVGRVLRMTEGEQIELFDGSNHIYPAKIIEASKKAVKVEILGCELSDKESNLSIHLGQVISRGD